MISNISSRNKIRWRRRGIPTFSLENNPILFSLDLFVPHYLGIVVHEPRVDSKYKDGKNEKKIYRPVRIWIQSNSDERRRTAVLTLGLELE